MSSASSIRSPPRLIITGRTAYMLSSFGEHLTGELIETCVLAASETIDAQVSEFSVGTRFGEEGGGELGHHVYVVEFADGVPEPARLAAFTAGIDRELAARNEDYEGAG